MLGVSGRVLDTGSNRGGRTLVMQLALTGVLCRHSVTAWPRWIHEELRIHMTRSCGRYPALRGALQLQLKRRSAGAGASEGGWLQGQSEPLRVCVPGERGRRGHVRPADFLWPMVLLT